MFFHSTEWGFDCDYQQKKKDSIKQIVELNLLHPNSFSCKISDLDFYLNNSVAQGKKFLAIVYCSTDTYIRDDFSDIQSRDDLITAVCNNPLLSHIKEELSVDVIEQLKDFPGCFTATIISDGQGRLLIECIDDTVNNRLLTSGSDGIIRPHHIIEFYDYKLIKCSNYRILLQLYDSIKTIIFFKGYYECSYAEIGKDKNVYFTYYSKNDLYQNAFLSPFTNYGDLKDRCRMLYLNQIGMI